MIQQASCIEKIPSHSTTSALATDSWEELAMRGEESGNLESTSIYHVTTKKKLSLITAFKHLHPVQAHPGRQMHPEKNHEFISQ